MRLANYIGLAFLAIGGMAIDSRGIFGWIAAALVLVGLLIISKNSLT